MEYPLIEKRTEEELLEQMEKKAERYTPEWRFDRENPDAGTALALVFARQQQRLFAKYNRLLYKNQIEFYNRLHGFMRPSAPAEGYVVFSLVNDSVDGVYLEKGVALTTDVDGAGGEKVSARTQDNLYVTPTSVKAIYESFQGKDYIGRLYDRDGEENGKRSLFSLSGENLEAHCFAFSHPSLFSFRRAGRLRISFGETGENGIAALLADSKRAVFEYSAEEGFVPFGKQYEAGGFLCLEKLSAQPEAARTELSGETQFWVRIRLLDGSLCGRLELSDLRLFSDGPSMAPDCVQAGDTDQGSGVIAPFGERFSVYDEVYFASDEALSKRGAWITLTFREAFLKVPVNDTTADEIRWKLIMPKAAVAVEKEYDITVSEVLWEYYNGLGWARLFPGKEYSDVFGVENGTFARKKTMVFQCPADMEPAFVGSAEACFIRARILKVNNGFKTEGQYIAPVLTDISFSYEYPKPGLRPEFLFCQSSMEERFFRAEDCLGGLYPWKPFWQSGDKERTVYVGFSRPVEQGPLRMLWVLEAMKNNRCPGLLWEYDCRGRWKELNPEDGTENFRRTGMVTFEGGADWQKRTLFGETLYWLRIRDMANGYGEELETPPVVSAIYMNASRVKAVRSGYEEYVTIDQYRENFRHPMLYSNIHSLEVWVEEMESLSGVEAENLRNQGRLLERRDGNGMVTEQWVRWEQKNSFSSSGPQSRHYLLDANEGVVTFGDNRRGRIPAVGVINGIHLRYQIGGGVETNLPAGAITGMEQSAGFINSVTNPLFLSGGYDRENAAEAVRRCAGELRHRFRAVTLRDFEELALEVSGNIARVRAISGCREDGSAENGHVSLVVLQKDYENGGHFFPELKKRIQDYLTDKTEPGLLFGEKLHILEPVFVKIGVRAEVFIQDYQSSYEIRAAVLKRLSDYLNPLTGGGSGKGFFVGTLPRREQLLSVMRMDDRIQYIGNVSLTFTINEKGTEKEVSEEAMRKNPYVLAADGAHRILMRKA